MNTKDDMFSPEEHAVLYAVRRAAQFGFHIADEYRTVAGIEDLGDPSRVTAEKRTEMQEKMRTASAVSLFSFASYLQHQVVGLATENERTHDEHVVLTEVALDQPMVALKCATYYLVLSLRNPTVKTAQAAATTIFAFAEKLIGEILQRQDSFEYFKAFSEMSYGLHETETDEEFVVTGFERHDLGSGSTEFNRFDWGDMVGNRDGKHMARREAQRLVCYNPREKKNVFQELGGLAGVWMGYGKPGTGKSLMATALATSLYDYCQALGMEFHFDPLPDDIIDSYQGKSAQKMMTYMRRRQSPKGIRFMSVDDAENVLIDRGHESASEGQRGAVGVLLRYLEGAYAITHGNVTMGLLTNRPEELDPAVRSRIQWKMPVDGASTVNDYMDQLRLYTKAFDDQQGFVNLVKPEGYTYFDDQKPLANIGEASETRSEPEHEVISQVFAKIMRISDPSKKAFFGHFFFEVMEVFPSFSSRDVRNITSAVDGRIMDFDLPEDWFENTEVFHDLEYDRQRNMVLELRNVNLGNLLFNELLLQESIRYLDSYANIANASFDRKVDVREEQVRVAQAVEARLSAEEQRTAGTSHAV